MRVSLSMLAGAAGLAALAGPAAHAAILYTTPNTTYSENFNTLRDGSSSTNTSLQATWPWQDDTTQTASNSSVPGWYLYHPVSQAEGGATGNQRIRNGSGNSNTGSFYNFGTNSNTDRALGGLASNTLAAGGAEMYIGVRITNNTGGTLDSITVDYTGEQWRDGGAATPVAQNLTFGYKLAAASLQDTGYTAVGALDFTSPTFVNTGAGAATDGNLPANRTVKSAVTISGLNWAAGTDLWLRWADINDTGNDHGLAVDDFNFSAAVPEPAAMSLVALIGAAALGRRRRATR